MPARTFSFKEVVITALVSLVISGIGGALFNEYLSRAKPSTSLISVAFKGPSGLIEVPPDLRTAAEKARWKPIQRYVSFTELLKDREEILERIAQLQEGIDLTSMWLEESKKAMNRSILTGDELQVTPFMKTNVVPDTLVTLFHFRDYSPPPHSMVQLRSLPSMAAISEGNQALDIDFGFSGIHMPEDTQEREYLRALHLLAESLSRGDRQNIAHYHQLFSQDAELQLRSLQRLEQLLRQLLVPRARLDIDAFVSNTGRSAVVIKPFFALVIDHPDFKGRPFILSTSKFAPSLLTGKDVDIAPLLPESSATPYFSVDPGQSKTVHLVGAYPLGDDAIKIVQIYGTGLLNCKIVGFTESGDTVTSSLSSFGAQINSSDKKTIEDQGRKM